MEIVIEKPKQKIIGSIFETYNYEMFSFFEENRDVDPANVEKIKKSMQQKRLLKPIIVDSNLRIIDGQHRYTACKELGISIQYLVDSNATVDDIRVHNTTAKTWKQKHYLEYYKKRGYKAYKTMYDFMIEHNITIREAIMYLDNDGGGASNRFKLGNLMIKDLKHSNWIASKMNLIKKINSKLGVRFYRTIIGLLDKLDIDVLIHKMQLQPTKLVPCSNSEQTKALIEEIYNYKSRKKVNLRI